MPKLNIKQKLRLQTHQKQMVKDQCQETLFLKKLQQKIKFSYPSTISIVGKILSSKFKLLTAQIIKPPDNLDASPQLTKFLTPKTWWVISSWSKTGIIYLLTAIWEEKNHLNRMAGQESHSIRQYKASRMMKPQK